MVFNSNTGISVILCCYNSTQRIFQTLLNLYNQKNIPCDWEIILVDNNSTDNTAKIAKEIWEGFGPTPTQFHIVEQPIPGLIEARKKGIETSRYSYLLFCDDDNRLQEEYVSNAFKILQNNPNIAALGGVGTAEFEGDAPFWFEHFSKYYATGIPHNPLRGRHKEKNPRWTYGAGIIILREIYDKFESINLESILVGRKGNNLSSGEDYELFYWMYIMGYEVTYDESLTFQHFIPSSRGTLEYLYKLALGLGQSAALLEIYQYLLGTSFDIVSPKRNMGLGAARYYLKKLIKLKTKILFVSDKNSLKYIQMNFGYYSIKGRIKGYVSSNNKFLELINVKKTCFKDYLDKV